MYQIIQYLSFLLKARTRHGVHSPLVYDLIENIFNTENEYYDFEVIENHRNELLRNKSSIEITDLGAGSRKLNSNTRVVSDIAKTSLSPDKYCRILFRLANRFRAESILELGTSLGVSTAYFSKARKNSKIYTLEGCAEIAQIARKSFDKLDCQNITQIEGNFDDTLPKLLPTLNRIDFAFIDGNHQEKSTLKYVDLIYPKLADNSVIIIDDIYWSPGMKNAWNQLISDSRFSLSLDLFKLGILFVMPRVEKEHFFLKV